MTDLGVDREMEEQEFEKLTKLKMVIERQKEDYITILKQEFFNNIEEFSISKEPYQTNDEQNQTNDEQSEEYKRRKLSSTTVCIYALSEYMLSEECLKDRTFFDNVAILFRYVLNEMVQLSSEKRSVPDDQLLDEFTLLNSIPLIKYIEKNIIKFCEKNNMECEKYDTIFLKSIISKLLDSFFHNQLCIPFVDAADSKQSQNSLLNFEASPHPFIHYKFLQIIDIWKNDLDEKCKKYSKEIYDIIYYKAKYELHRQVSLYTVEDPVEFDPKKLIYSLLIVMRDDRFTNNLVKDKAMSIIFEQQCATGLFPIGHVVSNDFALREGKIVERYISAKPMLISVECVNDMLIHDEARQAIRKYHENLSIIDKWIVDNVRKDPETSCYLGWYPEYESRHKPQTWVAAHTLLFLKNYHDFISVLITDNALRYLKATKPADLKEKKVKELFDSYNLKNSISELGHNNSYRSALLFGPPGSGKSSIAKGIAKELDWNYIEILPEEFQSKGVDMIIPNANRIFKRLINLENVVIFFDEVDQLIKSRKYEQKDASKRDVGEVWVVISLLPMFQALHSKKNVVYLMATNRANDIDPAFQRSGRLDMILPVGSIYWLDRFKYLYNIINCLKLEGKEVLMKEIFGDLKDDTDPNKILAKKDLKLLHNFLHRTNFKSVVDIIIMINVLFKNENLKTIDNIKEDIAFKAYFEDAEEVGIVDPDAVYFEFHNDLIEGKYEFIKLPSIAQAPINRNEFKKYIRDKAQDTIFISKNDWMEKGNSLLNDNKNDDAFQAFSRVIKIDPECSIAWQNMGMSLIKQNNAKDADKFFIEARRLGYTSGS